MNEIESKSDSKETEFSHLVQGDSLDEQSDQLFIENDENKDCTNDENSIANDLSTKDWYWSTISRAQANDLLHGKEDGTFLVRDSTSNVNDYTLTVKKDGINKMMRIMCINGKYGFRAPSQFDSLQSLIEYHTKHSLAEYYPEMNICLEHSLSKADICSSLNVDSNEIDVELLSEKLKMANQLYLVLAQKYDDFHRDYRNCQDDIQKFRQSLNCFEETFAIFDEQLRLNEENQKETMHIMAHEKAGLIKHYDDIQNKLEEIKEFRKQLEKQCEETNRRSTILDRKINELKPLLNEKKRQREQIKAILINKIGNEGIEKILEIYSNNQVHHYVNVPTVLNKPEFNSSDNYDHVHSQKLNYCQIDKEFLANACLTSNSQYNSPTIESNSLNCSIDDQINNQINSQVNNTFNCLINNNSITSPVICSNNNETLNNKKNEIINETTNEQIENSAYVKLDNQNFKSEQFRLDADWYVGNLSKEDVNTIMKNQPDGTFLVRDSKNRAEAPYTLTVRVNGSTKMLRILQSNDSHFYGFKPDKLEFESVDELIETYLKEPLIVFKPDLTIRLIYPITKEQIKNYLHS